MNKMSDLLDSIALKHKANCKKEVKSVKLPLPKYSHEYGAIKLGDLARRKALLNESNLLDFPQICGVN